MSWRTFHRRFRAAFGEPPRAYVQKLRLAAARLLLEAGAVPVEQVARRVGYEDPAFFRALFKRHTGMAASEYRERFRFRVRAALTKCPNEAAGLSGRGGAKVYRGAAFFGLVHDEPGKAKGCSRWSSTAVSATPAMSRG